ncbi:ABC transporter ATP-binding protein [Rhodopila globiformis]|uniref:ABC transporter ATP-binding protein n=1 Tax=Rhodopila globiformis TaxID=1071 RepID=A0A2S6NM75_RHOGL|nr:ABC transporter ATP-binding protein [Rhodopila globiformis]PPQ36863.1 ABC transporter ATP-binding protein [Rhodopila globiformis]
MSRAIGIEAAGIGKHFGSFHALSDVSLKVAPGTVHGLLGENGAGKSTLVKCLLGYYRADEGGFIVDGREAAIERPADADALGLGMVYQHFTLVPSMTVAENLVMARQGVPAVINWRAEIAALRQFMQRMPFQVKLEAEAGSLAAGERQKTEIIKQLYLERRFLVLDEPTSVLTPQEAEEMLGLVRNLAHSGALTIVIITHKLKEVFAHVDDVTVLRRGRMAGSGPLKQFTAADLTAMMIGEPHAPKNPERRGVAESAARLSVSGLRTADDAGRKGLSIDGLDVRAHEIVGVAGVSGNGQKELVEVLGGQRRATAGRILVEGAPYDASRMQSQAHGVRVLPEEPLRNGCVPGMTVTENLALRSFDLDAGKDRRFWLDRNGMAARAAAMVAAYGIRTPSPQAPIGVLSGGNVQRCVLARELDGDVRLLIVCNPCFGLDVKAVAETRARIMAARNAGAAVLLISEDLDEILELADRIVVMHDGAIVHQMPAAGADPQEIGRHMLGQH